jgi:uroporphyrinogen-III synthase
MGRVEGRRILVTRAEEDARAWADRIRERGARPEVLACLACRFRDDAETRSALSRALQGADWLALTSRRGVDAVAALLPPEELRRPRIASVGETTARRCRERLERIDLVAPGGTGRALGETLAGALTVEVASGRRPVVAVAAADKAPLELEHALEPMGVEVRRVVVYETIPAPPREPRVDLGERGIEVILLASPSAVEGLAAQATFPPSTQLVSIGPSTSEAIRRAGWSVAGEASSRDLEGLLEAIP